MADAVASREIFEIFAFDDVRERGMRCLKPLAPGNKVLESNPVVSVLGNNVRGLCCDFCFSRFEDLQRCSKCKFARYCNRECQKSAWKDHKMECERVLRVSPNVPTDLVRLMARILQLEHAERKSARKLGSSSATFQSCSTYLDSLVSHHVKFEQEQRDAFASICVVLRQFIGEQHFESHKAEELFQLFGKISCNSFTICDAELQPLGVGMYQAPSLLNHSCCPNCVVVFNGTKLLVHATENINKGDELTISYTELCCPSLERKKELKSRYLFECSCLRCSSSVKEDGLMLSLQCSDSSCQGALAKSMSAAGFAQCNACGKRITDKKLDAKSEAIILKSEGAMKQIEVLEKAANYQAILNLCETVLREQQGIFHKLHYRRVGILDKAMDACIFLELWNRALAFGLQTVEPYKLYYARNHPSVGIQLFRIGKLQVYLDKLEDGFQSLLQAEAILQVTHSGLPLVQELRELIGQTMEELRGERSNTRLQGVELI